MIEIQRSLEMDEELRFSFPNGACCNCASPSDLSVIEQDTRKTTYLFGGGTETTFRLRLPFCSRCAGSARRRPKSFAHRILLFLMVFGATALGLIGLGLAFELAALSEYLVQIALAIAAVVVCAVMVSSRPSGAQTSYFQPVRLLKLKREFVSGKIVRIRFAFTSPQYARLFADQNREVVSRKLVEVIG